MAACIEQHSSGDAPETAPAFPPASEENELPAEETRPVVPATAGGASSNSPGSELLSGIARLKAEQKALRDERKRVSKELRNAEKKRQRLKRKAKELTDKDLLEVLELRAVTRSAKSSAASAAAPSSGA